KNCANSNRQSCLKDKKRNLCNKPLPAKEEVFYFLYIEAAFIEHKMKEELMMAIVTFKSDVKWNGEGVLSTAHIGDKEVLIDEPESLGGTDIAPNPVEYLLAGLGGCINVLVVTFAEQFDVV